MLALRTYVKHTYVKHTYILTYVHTYVHLFVVVFCFFAKGFSAFSVLFVFGFYKIKVKISKTN